MLDLLARHSGIGLAVKATGDLETGAHHTVEDVGICFGRALDEALGDRSGINRYGYAVIPMDEARAAATIDLSGRPFAAVDVTLPDGRHEFPVGDLTSEEERVAIFALAVLPIPLIAGTTTPAADLDGEVLTEVEILYDKITATGVSSRSANSRPPIR
jgi:imidazoleglycerol-phosphate dehydratase